MKINDADVERFMRSHWFYRENDWRTMSESNRESWRAQYRKEGLRCQSHPRSRHDENGCVACTLGWPSNNNEAESGTEAAKGDAVAAARRHDRTNKERSGAQEHNS